MFRAEKVRARRRDNAKIAQNFHERIANFPEFRRTTRTEFVFLGQHALRKSYDVTEALNRVYRAFRSEEAAARRRDHVNFVRKSRGRIAKLPEIRRALRKKNCVYSASVRCATSRKLSKKSDVCSDPKKCASGVELTQNLRKKFEKEMQNFRKFGMPLAEEVACTRPAFAVKIS